MSRSNIFRKNRKFKVAIVHDALIVWGGAERVLFKLIEIFPKADIFTSLINDKYVRAIENLSKGKLCYSRLSKLSLALKYPSLLKPYFYHHYWKNLDLSSYDLVISSSHSFCANWVRVQGKHLSYIHTPPRFLYGTYNEMRWVHAFPFSFLFAPYFRYLRKLDNSRVQAVDVLVANSMTVQKRIRQAYTRDSVVVYPSVVMPSLPNKSLSKRANYLFFSRLVTQKGLQLVVETFNASGKPLIVVGEGAARKQVERIARKNIRFMGFLSDAKMNQIYARCKALVYAAIDEDFGMIPVEAMAHGLPVIAYKSGGVVETIEDGKTGVLFTSYTPSALKHAIETFEKNSFSSTVCRQRAMVFSKRNFKIKMEGIVRELMS